MQGQDKDVKEAGAGASPVAQTGAGPGAEPPVTAAPGPAAPVPVEPGEKFTCQSVLEVRWWTDTLFSFKTTRPANYDFTPGEYSRLGVLFRGDVTPSIWRAYSIVSAPHEDFLEYYGVLVEGGLFTGKLGNLKPGDPIWIDRQRFGFMTANRFADGDDLWMLATGTGLGPFISMLRDPMVWQGFRRLVLVHGVRHASELSYREELDALREFPPAGGARLHLARTSTRDAPGPAASTVPPASGTLSASDSSSASVAASVPDAAAGSAFSSSRVLHGRITTLLESGALETHLGIEMNAAHSRVMLCGNPEMIAETRAILHARDMKPCRRATPGQFVTENYW